MPSMLCATAVGMLLALKAPDPRDEKIRILTAQVEELGRSQKALMQRLDGVDSHFTAQKAGADALVDARKMDYEARWNNSPWFESADKNGCNPV